MKETTKLLTELILTDGQRKHQIVIIMDMKEEGIVQMIVRCEL
jgi:hypothetical protein